MMVGNEALLYKKKTKILSQFWLTNFELLIFPKEFSSKPLLSLSLLSLEKFHKEAFKALKLFKKIKKTSNYLYELKLNFLLIFLCLLNQEEEEEDREKLFFLLFIHSSFHSSSLLNNFVIFHSIFWTEAFCQVTVS